MLKGGRCNIMRRQTADIPGKALVAKTEDPKALKPRTRIMTAGDRLYHFGRRVRVARDASDRVLELTTATS